MTKINGRVYFRGTQNITSAALARLNEMGVRPPRNPYPQGGAYDSFYLPLGEEGEEFVRISGDPATPGRLLLKSERGAK